MFTHIIYKYSQVQEHSTLYELLKFRLIYTGKSVTEKERQHLNDLVLHEMSLVSTRNKNNIESQKLHLLFQSFFFTDVGDYNSASRTFYELNALLEKNIDSQNPPINYLSALDGILVRMFEKNHDFERK